jgi:NRPS condensation-like uncharacterized protein
MADTCRLVRDYMARQKLECIGLSAFPMIALANKCLPLSWNRKVFEKVMARAFKRGKVTPSFTNMGLIDDAQLNFGHIKVRDAFLVPPIVKPPYWAAGVSGFKDSLTLSSGFCASAIDTQRVDGLFNLMVSELLL